jgi:hypothetical protein
MRKEAKGSEWPTEAITEHRGSKPVLRSSCVNLANRVGEFDTSVVTENDLLRAAPGPTFQSPLSLQP